ncbi:MAG: TolC family protein [Opitutaceae bacterium]|nr:TolC family protein [Opitutaceae bacterium]
MKTILAAAAVLALIACRLTAQSTPPLTLDDCLALAVDRQPALAAAQAGLAAANEAVGEAQAPYYPQFDLYAGFHRWQKRAFLPSGLSLPGHPAPERVGPLDDWNGGLISRVTLYDFGERRAGLDAALARRAGAEADASTMQAEVRMSVHATFYALAAAQDLQTVAGKNLTRTESHLRLAEVRHRAGAVPEADVLRMQAEVASARLQLIRAQSGLRVATGQLNTAMGRAAETPLTITVPPVTPPPSDQTDLGALIERALAHRPEIRSAEKRTAAARANVAAARAARAPKLRADGSFGWNDTVWLPNTREWQAGLSIDVPVFDAGNRVRRVARTKADLAREEAILENRRLQIRQEVWTAAAELERSWASIAANETGVRASEESLRVVQERYQGGAAVITDLLDTQTALVRAEASLATARWEYLAARASFDRAVGGSP